MHKNLCILFYCCIFASEKETNNKLNPKTRKGSKIMTAKQQFANELNERMEMTVKTMLENKEWKEILSHFNKDQVVNIIATVFLTTNIKEGYEKEFINAFMSL